MKIQILYKVRASSMRVSALFFVLRLGTFVLKLGRRYVLLGKGFLSCQKVSRMIPHGKKRVAPIVLVRILTVRDTLALVTHLAMMI